MSKGNSHIIALDGIRGVAAVMVMIFHGWQSGVFGGTPIISNISRIAIIGQTGVDLFFVLSGFLITRILISSREAPGFFRNFYARRVLRIIPLYYLFLALFFFALPATIVGAHIELNKSWWYWVYLQNIPATFPALSSAGPEHFWSLAVEEHFYLVWPMLVLVTPVRRLAWLSGLIVLLALLFRWLFLYKLHLGVFFFTPCRMDALALGSLLACLEVTGKLLPWKKMFVVVLCIGLPVLAVVWTRASGGGANWVQFIKFTFVGALYWAMLGLTICFQHHPLVRNVLSNAPIRFAGKISYGLYVYHPICFAAVFNWIQVSNHGLMAFSLAIATTILVSATSFYFYESPFLRLKRFFEYVGPKPVASTTQASTTIGLP